jgi:hypothetical protein
MLWTNFVISRLLSGQARPDRAGGFAALLFYEPDTYDGFER